MPVLFLTLLLQSFFPIFDAPGGEYIGLSAVNTSDESAQVTVTLTGNDGSVAGVGGITLASGNQTALLLREILNVETTPASGWIQLDSSRQGTEFFLASGGDGLLGGAAPATSLSTTILLPNVRVDTGFKELGATDTLVAIVHPGSVFTTTVTLELIGLDGAVAGALTRSLAIRSSLTLRVSDAFGDFMPDNGVGGRTFEGYLRLRSTLGIAAWQRVETPLVHTVLRGRGLEELDSSGVVLAPYFVFGGGYRSTLNLINPSAESVSLELIAEDGRGGTLGETIQRTLGPGEVLRSDVQALFRVVTIQTFPGPTITGYVRVRETGGGSIQLIGSLDVASIGQGTFTQSGMSYPIGDRRAESWVIPLALGGSNYYSGYAIANPNELLAVQTDVTIEVRDSSGALIETSFVSLSPRCQHATVTPREMTSGWVRITSNMAVGLVAAIGTADSSVLEQVPASSN